MHIYISQPYLASICQFSFTRAIDSLPASCPSFSKWGASAAWGSVSLPNSKIPPLAVVGAIYCFVFPRHPLLLVLTADCLNSDLDLCGVLSPLRQSLMKAIRATCLPQYAACATVQSLGWVDAINPSPHRWSCFPRVICLPCFLRVLSGYRWYCQLLRWRGALYWLALPLPPPSPLSATVTRPSP